MKIIEGFKLRKLGNEYIVVGEGLGQVNFNKMIALNSSASYLWQEVEGREFDTKDLVELLLAKYDVDEETASKDAAALAKAWVESGIVAE